MAELYLKVGHIVWIDKPLEKYYRISRTEPFDYETGEEDTAVFSTVASGGESKFKPITLLEPDDKPLHFYQVLWGVMHTGNIKYKAKIPTGTNVFGVDQDKEIGYINAEKSPYYDPNPLYGFYLVSEWYPAINCINNSPVTITPKVWFRGTKYAIELLDKMQIQAVQAGKLPHRRIMMGGLSQQQG